ncbi:hypothetical protein GCM10025875_19780 [Litorihabitans aurantiacus]|uniref:Uncharacterized protein n=1 Tax=Litorihabitans aurantiacus TaxID=1930061 RepID=A0AA37XEY2_9MICO|nr:hypothetical protein GCM10025875_19780 [Litorihabitans aurantiacus]
MTATWEHSRSTSSITWLESTTVPPLATKSARSARMWEAETGSTDSKGSSSTRTLGACTSAVASPIFLVMPAE